MREHNDSNSNSNELRNLYQKHWWSQRKHKRTLLVLLILLVFECYCNLAVYHEALQCSNEGVMRKSREYQCNDTVIPPVYKYPLKDAKEVVMDYKREHNSSYYWFMSFKDEFKNLGDEENVQYLKDTPGCLLNTSSFGQIFVNKSVPSLMWLEEQNSDLKPGGYYAPAHCRPQHRLAVIVPYRNRELNLLILLRYIHPLLKKQLLEYRIFVIEQYGKEQFNKGTLYNIAFLEIQRFGTWDCLIFHDVDLVPEDERILYSCRDVPTHMSPAVEALDYRLPYEILFGGVTSLKPEHYQKVNGYSNFYWSWGAEDDDMYIRLKSAGLVMSRYDPKTARFASLAHLRSRQSQHRWFFLRHSKYRARIEGLISTKYKLISVVKQKLYTHMLADVNPDRVKTDMKSVFKQWMQLYGDSVVLTPNEKRLKSSVSDERSNTI